MQPKQKRQRHTGMFGDVEVQRSRVVSEDPAGRTPLSNNFQLPGLAKELDASRVTFKPRHRKGGVRHSIEVFGGPHHGSHIHWQADDPSTDKRQANMRIQSFAPGETVSLQGTDAAKEALRKHAYTLSQHYPGITPFRDTDPAGSETAPSRRDDFYRGRGYTEGVHSVPRGQAPAGRYES